MSRRSTGQHLRLALLGVLVFASAQVFWWMYDLGRHIDEERDRRRAEYATQLSVAEELTVRGLPPEEVLARFPALQRESGLDRVSYRVAPEAQAELVEENRRLKSQYRWEGGFFLLVLIVMMLILRRTIAAEEELRMRQEDFVAAVSHELKSPLASLQLAAESIGRRP